MANAMMQLSLYRDHNAWVFDDERFNLIAEPFVEGMSEIIDRLVMNTFGEDRYDTGVDIIFSKNNFPSSLTHIDWVSEDCDGNWYEWKDEKMEGWLCPALFHYFSETPKTIYINVL